MNRFTISSTLRKKSGNPISNVVYINVSFIGLARKDGHHLFLSKLLDDVKKDIDLQQSSSGVFNLLQKMTPSMSAFLSHTIC